MKKLVWLSIKYFLTFFCVILIPVYWYHYGVTNFLWLSDICLFLTVIALWNNSKLMMSIASVGGFFVESLWIFDFLSIFLFHQSFLMLADYMIEPSYSIFLRALSLFHIFMPIIWFSYLKKYYYDRRAGIYMTALYIFTIIITYFYTEPEKNINWVFLPQKIKMPLLDQNTWVLFLLIAFPLLIFLPTHMALKRFFRTKLI